jgi:hypothetical protein
MTETASHTKIPIVPAFASVIHDNLLALDSNSPDIQRKSPKPKQPSRMNSGR